MRYEQKAELQDSNKARMYEAKKKAIIYAEKKNKHNVLIAKIHEAKKKQDKLKKYSVTISKTISVLADDECDAEEQAFSQFDCTDLDFEVHDE